jgi:hypothetical protein
LSEDWLEKRMSDENSQAEKPDSGTKLESGRPDAEVEAATPQTSDLQDQASGQIDNDQGVTSTAGESTPAAAETAKATVVPAQNAVPARGSALGRFWWVVASFLLPFGILLLYLSSQSAVSWKLCLRSGFVGLGAAVVIYLLWKVDNKITGVRSGTMDVSSQLLLRMLAMMLWLVWVGASHVILLATDEIFPPLDVS